jgi:ParB family chromosome partitioning protein
MGHGRALVSVEDKELQLEYYKKILTESLSVRATETLINKKNQEHDSTVIKEIPKNILKDKIRISKNLNLNVKISLKSHNKGSISISFNNIEDYKKIIKKLSSEK